ncbi:MAG: CrcB family protein [Actinomycetota bacterium]|nr:CrcB family protein [Actinomycetota bacterium]
MSYLEADWNILAFWHESKMLAGVLFIILAGCGSLFRWGLQNSSRWKKPVGTLFANVVASFVLGILLADTYSDATIAIAGTGFLGSFSTFSTVMMEAGEEFEKRRSIPAILYLSASTLGGVVAALVGLEIGA